MVELISHIGLDVFVLLYGALFLFPVMDRLGMMLTVSISWFIAWTVIVFSYIIILLAGVNVSISNLLAALILILIFVLTWHFQKGKDYSYNLDAVVAIKFLKIIIIAISMTSIVVLFCDYIHFSPDSSQYDALISMLNRTDMSEIKTGGVYYWLYNARLPFFIIPHNIARLCGVDVYYSFTSLTSFFVLFGLTGFWLKTHIEQKLISYTWLLISLALLMSNIMVRFHTFYMHSNLLAMAYMSLGCLSLSLFIKTKDNLWFLLGCILLGSTGIIRKEMLLLSLIPFVVLGLKGVFPDRKTVFWGCGMFGLLSFLWFMNYCLASIDLEGLLNNGVVVTQHGGAEIVFVCLFLSIIIFVFPWSVLKKYSVKIFSALILGVMLFLYCYDKSEFISTLMELHSLVLDGKGFWGDAWSIFFLSAFAFFLVCVVGKEKRPTFESISFLTGVIFCYFVGRVVIYVILVDPSAVHWGSSGNRVLLHIYPMAAYCIGLIGYELSLTEYLSYSGLYRRPL